ncbi:hypothetical protein V2I01_32990 [Micromonospora sp. BRA006-A]|nr:hypothetical protein [Micromonospora sp. BRA006-A]
MWRTVLLPMLTPALISASLLVFMTSLASYTAPLLFNVSQTMTMQIYINRTNGDLLMAWRTPPCSASSRSSSCSACAGTRGGATTSRSPRASRRSGGRSPTRSAAGSRRSPRCWPPWCCSPRSARSRSSRSPRTGPGPPRCCRRRTRSRTS